MYVIIFQDCVFSKLSDLPEFYFINLRESNSKVCMIIMSLYFNIHQICSKKMLSAGLSGIVDQAYIDDCLRNRCSVVTWSFACVVVSRSVCVLMAL